MIISSRSPLGFLGKIPRNTRPKPTAPGGVAALSAAKSVVDIHDNVGRYDAARTEKGDKWKRRQRGETKEKEEKRGAKKHRGDGRMEPQVSRRTVRAATLSQYWSFQTTSREREFLLPFPLVIFSPRSETLSLRAVWARNRINKIALLRYFDEIMSIFDKAENFI